MDNGLFYMLTLMNGDNDAAWDFKTEEEAAGVYRAIVDTFSENELKEDGSHIKADDITQLKIITSYAGNMPRNVIASYTPYTWFTKETYPKILEWAYENIK